MRVVGLNFCQLLLSFVVWVGISTGGSTTEENLDKALAKSISKMTNTKVFLPGSQGFEARRRVNNDLCSKIKPALIAVPETTKHVSDIVRLAKYFGRPISVRSGGHSYTCTSIKSGCDDKEVNFGGHLSGVHIDMRKLNKIRMTNRHGLDSEFGEGPALELGPGSTWERVLKRVPTSRYTMMHGQCVTVGVGGYLLGGGVNIVGTSQRIGSGSSNVLQYTMVDTDGFIVKVTDNNATVYDPDSGDLLKVIPHDMNNTQDLFRSLQNAGSSYGITTEFLYRIYPGPEVKPVLMLIYIENDNDMNNLERMVLSGKFHVHVGLVMLERLDLIGKGFTKFLDAMKVLQGRNNAAIGIIGVDNFPKPGQITTDLDKFAAHLRNFGLKIAVNEKIMRKFERVDLIMAPTTIQDYESIYLTEEQRRSFPNGRHRPITSCNWGVFSSFKSFSKTYLKHHMFGLLNRGESKFSVSGCEFCFATLVPSLTMAIHRRATVNYPIGGMTEDMEQVSRIIYAYEMSCTYQPNKKSQCAKNVLNFKRSFVKEAKGKGAQMLQYYNTPACDGQNFVNKMFHPQVYERMLKTKKFWDPDNTFNHCFSIGSTEENCCPEPA